MSRWIFLFTLFLSNLHVAATRLSMVKFVYAERLALYLLDLFFAYFITNPTPVYLEQLSPIPALAAGA